MKKLVLFLIVILFVGAYSQVQLRKYGPRLVDWAGADTLFIDSTNVWKIQGGSPTLISGTANNCSDPIDITINFRVPIQCTLWWRTQSDFPQKMFTWEIETRELISGDFTLWAEVEHQLGDSAYGVTNVLSSLDYSGTAEKQHYHRLNMEANQIRICPFGDPEADSVNVYLDALICY